MRRWPTALLAPFALVAIVAAACDGGGGGDGGGDGDDSLEEERDEVRDEDEAEEEDEPSIEELIEVTVDDLQVFWAEELPGLYDTEYTEIPDENVREYGPSTEDFSQVSECLDVEGATTYEDVGPNAFYCPLDQTVVYDGEGLFPDIYEERGPFAVPGTLAHEWGHVIQDQAGIVEGVRIENPIFELQADCFEGAWFARVANGEGEGIEADDGDVEVGLVDAVESRDPVGTDPDDPSSHGSGFDRAAAFQDGFIEGLERCREYESHPPEITEFTFEPGSDSESREGNLPLDQLLPVVQEDLDLYWSTVIDEFDAPEAVEAYDIDDEDSLPECESAELEPDDADAYRGRSFYCSDDDTVYYDEALFDVVSEDVGDFGVAALVSNAYAAAVQEQLEVEGEPAELALQADCFSGSWAGDVPPLGDRDSEFSLSPGDLDEVVISFIAFADEGEDENEETGPFERLQAFRTGFLAGPEGDPEAACA